MRKRNKVHKSSGNVFRDIGVRHPGRVMYRAEIMAKIAQIIEERGITQKEAAGLLGLPQSKISCLMNGKLSMFSMEHLFEILNALNSDVEIIIKPKTREEKTASTHIIFATA